MYLPRGNRGWENQKFPSSIVRSDRLAGYSVVLEILDVVSDLSSAGVSAASSALVPDSSIPLMSESAVARSSKKPAHAALLDNPTTVTLKGRSAHAVCAIS